MKLAIGSVYFAVRGFYDNRWTVLSLSGPVRLAALRAFYHKQYNDLGFEGATGRLTPYTHEAGRGVILHEDVNWATAGAHITLP